jgi:hypothetical protein
MTDERERMLEHNVAVIGGILCTAVSLALALVVGRSWKPNMALGLPLGRLWRSRSVVLGSYNVA